LVENGEAVRPLLKKALHGEDRRAWRASLKYLGFQSDDSLCVEIPKLAWEEVFGQPMVWVPASAFLMGSDKSRDSNANDDELPQHSVTLPSYWIGRFPVSVARWKLFVKENDYKPDEKSLQDPDDHPARYVNWNDAMVYCKWLSEKSGLPVTLPSEAEWEKAARGTDGRIYPWGDEFDKDKCNTSESGIKNTTPVGMYSPAGDSPYGCADMAGNIWEWTRSKFKPYPYNAEDGRENLEGTDARVVRGGSWDYRRLFARASLRSNFDSPNLRRSLYSFRVVVRPPKLQG
jgi:formylglycine-generating enzyme required for sulfatase activity